MSRTIEQLRQDIVTANHAVDEAKKALFVAERAYREAVAAPGLVRFNFGQGGTGAADHLTDC
ncbi:hypothetical protein [Burkholderia pseudomallei]|uniref:hypothetical protein n=1 Tax=Burkholderia pseudomallei TaxID=28450 RepID=UPI0012F4D020|nr:hypothetical protein [Burkholderia pseudomallei]